MLKHFYKTAFIAIFGISSFQESFAQCPVNTSLVSDDTVCSNAGMATIVISNATIGAKYIISLKQSKIDSVIATSTSVLITTPLSKLPIGRSKFSVQAISAGCGIVNLKDSAIVLVNAPPRTDQRIVSKPYCPGSSVASIIIYGTRPGEIYEPFLKFAAIGSRVKSVTDTVLLTIPTINLPDGQNQIDITASIDGCSIMQLENKAFLSMAITPRILFIVSGDTICSSSPNAKITIIGSSSTIQYQMYRGITPFLDPFYGDASANTTVKNIPTSLLSIGLNTITVKATVNSVCQPIVLSANATILVNPSVKFDAPILKGDTVTMPVSYATITVMNPELGISYQLSLGNTKIGTSVSSINSDPIKLTIPVGPPNGLSVGIHEISVSFTILVCNNQTLTSKTIVVVKPEIITSIEDKQITTNFAVYPNPFSSEITITTKLKGQLKMQITDAIGNIVLQESISSSQDFKLNPDLKSGLYFLQMESEGARETVKLIKQ